VAGHDDQPLSRYSCPPLTTVAQNFEQLGARALNLLLRIIADGENAPDQVHLDARLILRQSA